jgi:multicomponent Na+:H+ antiporter subunit D
MSELGLLGGARVYWTVFAGPFDAHAGAVRGLLLGLAVLSMLLGAVMALLQRHLKRMLAYVTVSHGGVVLAAIALLDPKALAGAANLALSQGLLKGGLFLAAGILLQRLDSVDELTLHGRARRFRLLGALFLLAALGLSGVPFVGTFLGHSMVDDVASDWLPPLILIATLVSSAAVLRAGLRVFLGVGAKQDPLLTREPPEQKPEPKDVPMPAMLIATAALILLGVVMSVVPGLERRSQQAAERFQDRAAYAAHVLAGRPEENQPRPPFELRGPTLSSALYGVGAGVGAVALGLLALYRRRTLPLFAAPLRGLKAVHSGAIGDYVMWLTLGAAVVGWIWAGTLR